MHRGSETQFGLVCHPTPCGVGWQQYETTFKRSHSRKIPVSAPHMSECQPIEYSQITCECWKTAHTQHLVVEMSSMKRLCTSVSETSRKINMMMPFPVCEWGPIYLLYDGNVNAFLVLIHLSGATAASGTYLAQCKHARHKRSMRRCFLL